MVALEPIVSTAKRNWEELHRKVPIGYNGTPQIHSQNCPLSFDDDDPPSNTPIPRPTPLTISTASGSTRFYHTDRQTDRPTDGQTNCQVVRHINRLRSPVRDVTSPHTFSQSGYRWLQPFSTAPPHLNALKDKRASAPIHEATEEWQTMQSRLPVFCR